MAGLQAVFFHSVFILGIISVQSGPCIPQRFDQDSIVCVCNSTYCDTYANIDLEPNPANPIPYYNTYMTTRSGLRMEHKSGSFDLTKTGENVFTIKKATGQRIKGFGGAFTDAATLTMNSLSPQARSNLIDAYFSSKGIEYNIGRIPMGSCDFSTHVYSYDDTDGDFSLEHFSLAEEDLNHKIPAIKDAMAVSRRNISLFGSPWSSPYWMKTNLNMTGRGSIIGEPGGEYYKTWAKYFVKFIQAYKDNGVNIWGVTTQNEPTDGDIPGFNFQCLGWTPQTQRDFIAKDLGPALEANGFGNVKVMIFDDQRELLPYWTNVVLSDTEAAKYVSGVAVHWYIDLLVPPSFIDRAYEKFGSDYFFLNTEACEQDLINKNRSVLLGSWYRGEHYFKDIMQDLQHGISGWIDWNMALNMEGGPNWVNNFADSPIIVNADKDEFYKQPMYYAMGHYSKFVTPGSVVVSHDKNITTAKGVDAIFFRRDRDIMIGNIVNIDEQSYNITVVDPNTQPNYINIEIPAKSFVTLQWFTTS
ncbi:hypothetical protein ACF0H5_004462 [Mactra antiquata]